MEILSWQHSSVTYLSLIESQSSPSWSSRLVWKAASGHWFQDNTELFWYIQSAGLCASNKTVIIGLSLASRQGSISQDPTIMKARQILLAPDWASTIYWRAGSNYLEQKHDTLDLVQILRKNSVGSNGHMP